MPSFIEQILAQRPEWEKMLTAAMKPGVDEQIQSAMKDAFAKAKQLGIVGAFDVNNPRVKQWAEEYCAKRVTLICDATEKRLKEVISQSLDEGKTISELRRAILDDPLIGEVSTAMRAERIARTETANAFVNGTRLGCLESNQYAQEAGLPAPFSHQVLAANPLCCDLCNELDGILMWRMDENIELVHVNCRCSTRTIVNPAYAE